MRSSIRCASGTHSQIQECCDTNNPCDEGQGDCDKDSECSGNLICGKNNCHRSKFPSNKTDCCTSIGAVLNQGSDDPNFFYNIWALYRPTYKAMHNSIYHACFRPIRVCISIWHVLSKEIKNQDVPNPIQSL